MRFDISVISFHIFNVRCSEILLPVSLSKPFYVLNKLTNVLIVTVFPTHTGTLFSSQPKTRSIQTEYCRRKSKDTGAQSRTENKTLCVVTLQYCSQTVTLPPSPLPSEAGVSFQNKSQSLQTSRTSRNRTWHIGRQIKNEINQPQIKSYKSPYQDKKGEQPRCRFPKSFV